MESSKPKRCIFCKKLLVDEMFMCRRCKIEGRSAGIKVITFAGGAYLSYKGGKELVSSFQNRKA